MCGDCATLLPDPPNDRIGMDTSQGYSSEIAVKHIAITLLAPVLTQSAVVAAPRTPKQVLQQATKVIVSDLHRCVVKREGSRVCWELFGIQRML